MATHMTTAHTSTDSHAQSTLLQRSKSLLLTWLERVRTRRELAELPPYLLKDIGLTESDRFCESHKPFWRG